MLDVVSPLLASFVRQSETLLVDVTLSVRQIIVEKLHRILSCHETSARVTLECALAAEVLSGASPLRAEWHVLS